MRLILGGPEPGQFDHEKFPRLVEEYRGYRLEAFEIGYYLSTEFWRADGFVVLTDEEGVERSPMGMILAVPPPEQLSLDALMAMLRAYVDSVLA